MYLCNHLSKGIGEVWILGSIYGNPLIGPSRRAYAANFYLFLLVAGFPPLEVVDLFVPHRCRGRPASRRHLSHANVRQPLRNTPAQGRSVIRWKCSNRRRVAVPSIQGKGPILRLTHRKRTQQLHVTSITCSGADLRRSAFALARQGTHCTLVKVHRELPLQTDCRQRDFAGALLRLHGPRVEDYRDLPMARSQGHSPPTIYKRNFNKTITDPSTVLDHAPYVGKNAPRGVVSIQHRKVCPDRKLRHTPARHT